MKRYFLIFFFAIIAQAVPAQVSGFMGKRHVVSFSLQQEGSSLLGDIELLKQFPHFTISIERAVGRKTGLILHARHIGGNTETFGYRESTFSIRQIGIEIADYSVRSWTSAPMGRCRRWGINYNIIPYQEKVYNETTNKYDTFSGTYSFPSISWQYNYRMPIVGKLCFDYGIGLEIPLTTGKFEHLIDGILINMMFSRLLNAGVSYMF